MILDDYSILFFFNFILKISSLILNLEDSLVDITTTDAWLMTILWPEDSKLTWLAGNERLRFHTRILGYILSLVIFHFRKISKRSIAISLLVVKRNLNINHLAMCFKNSIFLAFSVSCRYINKEVTLLDKMLTVLQFREVIIFDKLHYISEERIERNIFLQIV